MKPNNDDAIIEITFYNNDERNNNFINSDEQLKLFLKKTMDVYSTISEKVIIKTFNDEENIKQYQLTEIDKKELSLLIASILTNGNTKNIMQKYFNLDEILSFVNISEERIHKLDETEYADFYDKHFSDLIDVILWHMKPFLKTNNITSEIVVQYLRYSGFLNIIFSNIFHHHPFFKELELYLIENKMMLSQLEYVQSCHESFYCSQNIQAIPTEGIPSLRKRLR